MDLKTLTEINAPSGHEQAIRRFLLDELKKLGFAPVLDRMGNVVVVKEGTGDAPRKRVMVSAHMDEVGLIVTSATEDGYLRIAAAGGIDPRVLVSKRVTVGEDKLPGVRELCRGADVILPNLTEACLLLGLPQPQQELDQAGAGALAEELAGLCGQTVVTGLPQGRHLACAGGGKERFVVQRLRIDRSYPGTGDLFASVLVGALLRGNAVSAAADAAAGFVAEAIENTDPAANPALGVWFEPLLGRLAGRGV